MARGSVERKVGVGDGGGRNDTDDTESQLLLQLLGQMTDAESREVAKEGRSLNHYLK